MILFYLGVAAAVCGGVGLFMFGSPSIPDTRDWILAIAIALLGMIQQYILVWAVQVISQTVKQLIFDYENYIFLSWSHLQESQW